MTDQNWIAVDGNTTRLRAFHMGPDGIAATASADVDPRSLTRDGCEAALLALISPWLGQGKTSVLACGMIDLPYRTVPCAPVDHSRLIVVATKDPRLDLRLVPGLQQISPMDVMRGAETQIAGALAVMPHFDGVFCLLGRHSRWVQISAGEVVSFQSFMTGEMIAMLSKHLRLQDGIATEGWDSDAFSVALSDAMSRPERIAAHLFSLHAEAVIADLPQASAHARLSGLLIGIELAAARPYWLGQDIVLIGTDGLTDRYLEALKVQGVSARHLDATACTLAGLAVAKQAPPR